jgi:hypothetical protein
MAIEDEIALLTKLRSSELLFLQCNSYCIWLHVELLSFFPPDPVCNTIQMSLRCIASSLNHVKAYEVVYKIYQYLIFVKWDYKIS